MPSTDLPIQRLAAFSLGETGGNPAGVVLCETLPAAEAMQALAAEIGYSETVFAAPLGEEEGGENGDAWRARYFAPEIEVPFCGHATIALGAALARRAGDAMPVIPSPPVASTRTRPRARPPAALGGYLRDLGWPHGGKIEIFQGEDMEVPSRIEAAIPPQPGAGIRVGGRVRLIP